MLRMAIWARGRLTADDEFGDKMLTEILGLGTTEATPSQVGGVIVV